jgi:hypothetical protein
MVLDDIDGFLKSEKSTGEDARQAQMTRLRHNVLFLVVIAGGVGLGLLPMIVYRYVLHGGPAGGPVDVFLIGLGFLVLPAPWTVGVARVINRYRPDREAEADGSTIKGLAVLSVLGGWAGVSESVYLSSRAWAGPVAPWIGGVCFLGVPLVVGGMFLRSRRRRGGRR